MTDLQCPATVVFVSSSTTLVERRAGIFATPAAHDVLRVHGGAVTLTEATNVEGLRSAIDHLADLHRGETIVVVASREEICGLLALSDLPEGSITLSIDASGWSVARA